MKQQLAPMQKAESTEPSIQSSQESITANVDSCLFYFGGLVILGGLGILTLKHFNKLQPQPKIQMSPVLVPPPNSTWNKNQNMANTNVDVIGIANTIYHGAVVGGLLMAYTMASKNY